MTINNSLRAEILQNALPYIQEYRNKVVVVKYGGHAMTDTNLKQSVMKDIVLLSMVGVKVVLVHGGGPEISALLKKIGKESEFVDGLRVTDEETIDVVQMVLSGKLSKELVSRIESVGGKAVGLCGLDGGILRGRVMDARLGYVGEITDVNTDLILNILEKGYIPVISSLAMGEHGETLNVNADTAASCIAGALNAECLISMTDIAGVMRDKDDPSTLLPVIKLEEAPGLMESGVISGGMIPKVNCCMDALYRGVKKVFIIDGTLPHAILVEILTNEGIGTMFIR